MVAVAKDKRSAFAVRLRALREAAGYTQAEVASEIGVGYQTYLRWERGEREPEFTQLSALASMFGVTLNDFAAPEEGEGRG